MSTNFVKRNLVLLVSGKRKSGKDYLCEQIVDRLGKDQVCIMRISAPLKGAYAKTHNLNIDELMSSGKYKEKYRLDMIKWSDDIREKDPGYFCRLADEQTSRKPITIVSDIRRKTDLAFFEDNFAKKTVRIRIVADNAVRESRGYSFTPGVDDGISECGLDDVESWDLVLENNSVEGGQKAIETLLENIEKWCKDLEMPEND